MTLMVPPSQSQGVTDMLKAQVPLNKLAEKARKASEKAAREAAKEKLRLERPVVGGCAGTREGCSPKKKIEKLFNKKMKKCVKAPCPAW